MQVQLHTDSNTDGRRLMAEHLTTVVNGALGRFGERVTRVEAHLSNVNGQAKSGDEDIHCTLEARLVGLDPVIVKDYANNAHQAIDSALCKLKRAVGTALSVHDPRGQKGRSTLPVVEDPEEIPD